MAIVGWHGVLSAPVVGVKLYLVFPPASSRRRPAATGTWSAPFRRNHCSTSHLFHSSFLHFQKQNIELKTITSRHLAFGARTR